MMLLPLFCDVCREQIGRFDPDKVSLPLKGEMFLPIDDVHGYPPPFPPGATWEHFYCIRDAHPTPTMRHRPITQQDRILTQGGFFQVGSQTIPGMDFNPNVTLYSDEDLDAEWNERANQKEKKTVGQESPKKQVKKPKVKEK